MGKSRNYLPTDRQGYKRHISLLMRCSPSRNYLPTDRQGYICILCWKSLSRSLEITSPPIGRDTQQTHAKSKAVLVSKLPPHRQAGIQRDSLVFRVEKKSRNYLPTDRQGYRLIYFLSAVSGGLEITSPPIGRDTSFSMTAPLAEAVSKLPPHRQAGIHLKEIGIIQHFKVSKLPPHRQAGIPV